MPEVMGINDVKLCLGFLVEEARQYGWCGDYSEVTAFIEQLHIKYDVEVPDLEPYPVKDD